MDYLSLFCRCSCLVSIPCDGAGESRPNPELGTAFLAESVCDDVAYWHSCRGISSSQCDRAAFGKKMTRNKENVLVPGSGNHLAVRALTLITTSVGGFVAFGLVASVIAPSVPGIAFLAAVVGLIGGFLATRLDKIQIPESAEEVELKVPSQLDATAGPGKVRRRSKNSGWQQSNSWGATVLIIVLGLVITLPFLTVPRGTVLIPSGIDAVSFDPIYLWNNMGLQVKCVVVVLFIMFIWSLAVVIDRALYFAAAKKQSREFAPRVAGALKEGKLGHSENVWHRCSRREYLRRATHDRLRFASRGYSSRDL
jgi:hypothetical protein